MGNFPKDIRTGCFLSLSPHVFFLATLCCRATDLALLRATVYGPQRRRHQRRVRRSWRLNQLETSNAPPTPTASIVFPGRQW